MGIVQVQAAACPGRGSGASGGYGRIFFIAARRQIKLGIIYPNAEELSGKAVNERLTNDDTVLIHDIHRRGGGKIFYHPLLFCRRFPPPEQAFSVK